jgi:hypothetical protein
MMGSRRAVVYLVLVFLLGFALGALGMVWAGRHGWTYADSNHHRRPKGVEWLDRELNLSPEQHQQVEAILDEMGQAYREIRQRTRPEYDAVRQKGRDRIRALLREEQRPRFEQLVRELDEREARRRQERDAQESGKRSRSD